MRNRFAHRTVLLGGLLALLLLAAPDARAQQDPYQVNTYPVVEHAVVRALVPHGDIEVIGEEGRKDIRIELYVNRGISVWSRGGNLDNYRFSSGQRGREIYTSVEPRGTFGGDQIRFSYRILTPPNVALRLQTSSGNIDVRNVRGRQQEFSTSRGDITVRNSSGVIYGNTNRGNIELEGCEGEIRLRIVGGQIHAEQIRGDMVAQITRGDIQAQFERVRRGMNLQTTQGDISVRLPVQPFEFDLSGSEVNFTTTGSFEGIRRHDRVEGSYREGGGPRIILVTRSGNVTVATD